VGTPKRERQKANRQQRLQELERHYQRQKTKRRALQIGIIVPVALVGLVVLALLVNRDNDEGDATSTTSTTTSLPGSTTTAATTTTAALPTTVPGATITGETPCPAADGSSERAVSFEQAPPMCIDASKTYTATFVTNKGDFTVTLDAAAAPDTVNNFVVLARYHFFDDTVCHRIIPGFVIQCGDPEGTGLGGPGYSFADELPTDAYEIGDLAMANSGPDTQGSQFFVITGASGAALDPNYSRFGAVAEGLDTTVAAIDELGNPDPGANGVPPLEQIVIESVTISEA
jgi:cyclophilin family peptidyl-prolyl cis-trans isomerase